MQLMYIEYGMILQSSTMNSSYCTCNNTYATLYIKIALVRTQCRTVCVKGDQAVLRVAVKNAKHLCLGGVKKEIGLESVSKVLHYLLFRPVFKPKEIPTLCLLRPFIK